MPEALKRLIDIIAFLPGIGEKTAAKLAFFVLKSHSAYRENFAKSLSTLHTDIQECTQCHGMTDHISPLCRICSDTRRDTHILCVVEDYLDMVSIEKSGVYTGLYHILGGAISPIHGITPRSLTFDHLFARIADSIDITEIILATNPNIEGEATALYATENIPKKDIKITRISRGLPYAGSIEYADEITIMSAFRGRG